MIFEGIKGILKAILRIDRADKELIKARDKECSVCIHEYLGVCTECGCVLRFKNKIRSEKCPKHYW